MKNTSKFQNVVIVTIVGWLVLFVFLPNLMIIGTSFLTRDDASFVKMVFTLDNYTRLLDPLYFEVLLHSLNMALIATVGHGMVCQRGVAAKLFDALVGAGVNVRMIDQGSSEMNIIVGVESDDFDLAVRAIYEAFVTD